MSAPEGRPTDTIYANPFVATVNGVRMFFSGGSDGAMHALKANTGEPVWNWLVSKRGLNTAALVVGDDVIVTHSEENIITNEMGMLAAVPAASTGTLTDKDARWLVRGVQAATRRPSPMASGIYVLDNGGVLLAFDLKTASNSGGNLGTIAKASPVLADGKLYLGTENTGDAGGKFYIIRPVADKAEDPRSGLAGHAAAVRADHRLAHRRARPRLRHLDGCTVCDRAEDGAGPRPKARSGVSGGARRPRRPATLLVTPDRADSQAGRNHRADRAAFDAKGNPGCGRRPPTWALENLKGTVADGKFTADKSTAGQAGLVKATVGALDRHGAHPRDSGSAVDLRLRGTAATCRRRSGSTRPASSRSATWTATRCWSSWRRTRSRSRSAAGRSSGSTEFSNYTIEADVRGMERAASNGRHRDRGAALRAGACSATTSASSCSPGSRRSSAR